MIPKAIIEHTTLLNSDLVCSSFPKNKGEKVILEGNALYRRLVLNGVELDLKWAIKRMPELKSETFQWGCKGLYIPQLLSSFAILMKLIGKKEVAAIYTNVLDFSLLSQLPPFFKLEVNLVSFLQNVIRETKIHSTAIENNLEGLLRHSSVKLSAQDDPNAFVADYGEFVKSGSSGSTLIRK